MYNNFEISLVVFMPKITTNHAITSTNQSVDKNEIEQKEEKENENYSENQKIGGTAKGPP